MNIETYGGAFGSDTSTEADDNILRPDGSIVIAERLRTDNRKMAYKLTTMQERDLAQDYADGHMTVTAIAEKYSVSHVTTRRIALNHGVPQRAPGLSAAKTKVDPRRAIRLRFLGVSIADIAEIMGANIPAITNIFARYPEARLTNEQRLARLRASKAAKAG